MCERGLDGTLLFRQESMYHLTGYDSFGYCFFQCLYLDSDGRTALLTRAPDLRQARHTSDIEDIRIWVDAADHNPAEQVRDLLIDYAYQGKRLGVEYETYGLNARYGRMLDSALAGFCELNDASTLVSGLRAVKSATELAYVRRTAALADDALEAALENSAAGAVEGDILAAMLNVIFRGGDYPGNEFVIGSGRDALLYRYHSGRRHLDEQDQLTLEFAGVYRRYHAALMRMLLIGTPHPEQVRVHAVAAMQACIDALRPGEPIGHVFDAHARVLDLAGMHDHRLNACGYSLGATYTPTWMD